MYTGHLYGNVCNYHHCCTQDAKPSLSRTLLEEVSLPNDDKATLELKQVAAIALAHLELISEPMIQLEEVK